MKFDALQIAFSHSDSTLADCIFALGWIVFSIAATHGIRKKRYTPR